MLMREPSVRRPSAEGGQMTALLLSLLSPLAAALQMRSGEFVPLDAPSGFLACPQSLTTREGLGFCIGADPLGATATDVFVQCSAQRIEPEYGDSVMYRFPLVAIDHGVPTFGAPITLPQEGVLPGNVSLASLSIKTIVQTSDSKVLLAAFSSDRMHILELIQNGTRWSHVLTSDSFALPVEWGGSHFTSAAVVRSGKPGESTDGWRVYASFVTGNSTRALSEWSGHGRDTRAVDYYPYSGEGIWRGTLPLMGVGTFFIGSKGGTKATSFRRITDPNWTGALMSLELALLRSSNASSILVGAVRTGLLYIFDIDPPRKRRRERMQQVFQEPVPLANSDTGLLFEARVIGAKPIPFPGSTADDLIMGGENGIFFVPVTRAGLQPPSVSDGGPVLEAGATLVTGQTPL